MKKKNTIILMHLIGIIFTLYYPIMAQKSCYLDIAKLGYEQYQDIFINGKVVQSANNNHNDCEVRYQIINSLLSQYKRPFTMLDIGASQGYYSFRAATHYPNSVFVMIEGDNPNYPLIGKQLLDLCSANTNLNNIILLNQLLTVSNAKRLSECEHFDIILALNIIHWFENSWKDITDAILNMGDYIIIETPPQEKITNGQQNKLRKNIEEYLCAKNAQVLGKVKRHTSDAFSTIYLIYTGKSYLERKTWLMPLLEEKTHCIQSDFNQKKLQKNINNEWIETTWHAGINLLTFKMSGGIYPNVSKLKKILASLNDTSHNDWLINNMIIQGEKIVLIDFNDSRIKINCGNVFSEKLLLNHYKILDLTQPDAIKNFFWKHLL